jgi:hypothetical protein
MIVLSLSPLAQANSFLPFPRTTAPSPPEDCVPEEVADAVPAALVLVPLLEAPAPPVALVVALLPLLQAAAPAKRVIVAATYPACTRIRRPVIKSLHSVRGS